MGTDLRQGTTAPAACRPSMSHSGYEVSDASFCQDECTRTSPRHFHLGTAVVVVQPIPGALDRGHAIEVKPPNTEVFLKRRALLLLL